MKKTQIVADYKATAGKSFDKAGAFDLQGWCQTYEIYLESGLDTVQFGQVLEDANLNKVATVKQNLSHIKWAIAYLSETMDDDATIADVVVEFTNVNAIRGLRYPNKTTNKTEKKQASKSVKFDAKVRAKDFTVAQLLAMLAEKGVK
jgi:hypothetical protein